MCASRPLLPNARRPAPARPWSRPPCGCSPSAASRPTPWPTSPMPPTCHRGPSSPTFPPRRTSSSPAPKTVSSASRRLTGWASTSRSWTRCAGPPVTSSPTRPSRPRSTADPHAGHQRHRPGRSCPPGPARRRAGGRRRDRHRPRHGQDRPAAPRSPPPPPSTPCARAFMAWFLSGASGDLTRLRPGTRPAGTRPRQPQRHRQPHPRSRPPKPLRATPDDEVVQPSALTCRPTKPPPATTPGQRSGASPTYRRTPPRLGPWNPPPKPPGDPRRRVIDPTCSRRGAPLPLGVGTTKRRTGGPRTYLRHTKR